MKHVLFKNISFKDYSKNFDNISKNFAKDCFMNRNTLELIYTCIFSLKHDRHPIIAGNSGIGKKLLACILGDYLNEYTTEKNSQNNEDLASSNNLNTSTNVTLKANYNKNNEQSLNIVYCSKIVK